MKRSIRYLAAFSFLCLPILAGFAAQPADDPGKVEKQRCPKPAEFALVFSRGYAADKMPMEDDPFEVLLKKIKDGGFNVIHCPYTEQRLALCKKHGVKLMVDLLIDDYHVYKHPEKAKSLCEKLRNNRDVWGYNIWNDGFGKSVNGRKRDISNVRQWDPTHPAYCGTYRAIGMKGLNNPDIFGYYDFHWKRGMGQHFPHLLAYSNWAKERHASFYTWLSCTSGQAGKGNFNRNLYSANTGIACGLKGILWFLATDMMDSKTQEWTEVGRDIIKVQKEIAPLSKEIAKLGHPSAIYSTPVTKTMNNAPIKSEKKEAFPPGLEGRAFAKDFWLQPVSGEFVLGAFQDAQKRDCVFIANNNAYVEQEVAMKLAGKSSVEVFNRAESRWRALELRAGAIRISLSPGGGELLRFEK